MRAALQLCVLLVAYAVHGKAFASSPDALLHDVRLSFTPSRRAGLAEHPTAASFSPGFLAGRQLTQTSTPSNTSRHGTPADHKPLFPVGSLDIAVLIIAGVVLFIAAGAGMGGGPVLVPLYLVAGLNNTAAVALSNSTILAGSIGNTLCNVFKRHPYKNKPLIDWDLVLLMEPPTLIGAIAGSYINKLLPAWITSVLLVLLLALMTVRIAQRAARIYQRESAAKQKAAAAAATELGKAVDSVPGPPVGHNQQASQSSATALLPPATVQSSLTAVEREQLPAAAGSYAANTAAAAPRTDVTDKGNGVGNASAGVMQLLGEERAAHIDPYDQQDMYNNSRSTSGNMPAGLHTTHATRHKQHQPHGLVQQKQHSKHSQQPHGRTIAASAPATPFERPGSPVADALGSTMPASQVSSFRGTLSTVPSSVLLNVELEGGMSEAALQRLAMLEISSARSLSGSLDAADASLASMYGISSGHHWQQQAGQQAVGRSAQHQVQERSRSMQQQLMHPAEPPSEAEFRLAYAPPDHTRRDSWELAWEGEQQEEVSGTTSTGVGIDANTLSPSAPALGTASSQDQTAAIASRAPLTTPPRGVVPGAAAAAGNRSGPQLLASLAAAPAAPEAAHAAASAATATASRHTGALELMSGAVSSCQPAQSLHLALQASPAGPFTAAPAARGTEAHGVVPDNNANCTTSNAPHKTGSSAGTYPPPQQPSGANSSSNNRFRPGPKAPEVAAATRAAAIERMLAAEAQQLPLLPVVLLLVMFAAVLLTSLLSKMMPCGSVGYWLVQWAVVPVLLGVWGFSRRRVLAKVQLKKAAQMDFHGEVRWTPRKSLVFPAICSMAGIIAGMFGLGGAVVKTPLMLELGVHPLVTAATTQTMLLLTSSASSIVYAQLGDTPWDWATVMLPMAFAATLAGQAAIDYLVKKVGRSSMVVLVLSAFFIVATCLSIYTLSGAARAVATHPELLGKLGKICR